MKKGLPRTLQSAKYLDKKRKRFILKIIFVSISLLFLVILIVLGFNLPFLQIKTIQIYGNTSISSVDLQRVVFSEIEGNYFYTVPKTNILFYPKLKLKAELQSRYPKISSLEIDIIDSSVINVKILERSPEVIVCEGYLDDEDGDSCFFVDDTGTVYEKVNASSSDIYFKYYMNTSSTTISIGSKFIESSKFLELQEAVSYLNGTILEPTGLLIRDDGSYELYIRNIDTSIAVVYLDDRIPFKKTMNNLVLFWQNVMNKKLGFSEVPNFEYINLRFGNNVFYLVKNDNGKPE
jgi:hypothetical protein